MDWIASLQATLPELVLSVGALALMLVAAWGGQGSTRAVSWTAVAVLLGAGIAYGLFNGYSVSTMGGGFTQVAFNFAVTPSLVVRGLVWALAIGFIGGFFPAIRAARLPVTEALRG